MKLSVIVVRYGMQRELPRTLESLARDYQLDAADLDYEVLLVDNGSSQALELDTALTARKTSAITLPIKSRISVMPCPEDFILPTASTSLFPK